MSVPEIRITDDWVPLLRFLTRGLPVVYSRFYCVAHGRDPRSVWAVDQRAVGRFLDTLLRAYPRRGWGKVPVRVYDVELRLAASGTLASIHADLLDSSPADPHLRTP